MEILNETLKRTGYEYDTLMNLLHVSVSKHILDEYYTLVWCNDYYYELIGYSREEYEALYHNKPAHYYMNDDLNIHDEKLWTQLSAKVMETLENKPTQYHVLYPDEMSLKDKINTIAKEIYGADGASFAPAAAKALKRIEDMGFGNLPVCMAKTQYSLSDDQTKLGRPAGFTINVRDAYVSAGAGFVVALTGSIMTMPGLPKKPAADSIDVDENGKITGLF